MCEISFSRPSKRSVESEKSSDSHITKRQLDVTPPSDLEWDSFFESISKAKDKPAILKIIPPYSKVFITTLSCATYPKPIMELYNLVALELRYHELLTECEYHELLTECEKTIKSIKVSSIQGFVACVYIATLYIKEIGYIRASTEFRGGNQRTIKQ